RHRPTRRHPRHQHHHHHLRTHHHRTPSRDLLRHPRRRLQPHLTADPPPGENRAMLVRTAGRGDRRHDSPVRRRMATGTGHTRTPGDLVLQPAVVTSLGALVLNDHVLKGRWPGWFTGKASDVVGLYAFP